MRGLPFKLFAWDIREMFSKIVWIREEDSVIQTSFKIEVFTHILITTINLSFYKNILF